MPYTLSGFQELQRCAADAALGAPETLTEELIMAMDDSLLETAVQNLVYDMGQREISDPTTKEVIILTYLRDRLRRKFRSNSHQARDNIGTSRAIDVCNQKILESCLTV